MIAQICNASLREGCGGEASSRPSTYSSPLSSSSIIWWTSILPEINWMCWFTSAIFKRIIADILKMECSSSSIAFWTRYSSQSHKLNISAPLPPFNFVSFQPLLIFFASKYFKFIFTVSIADRMSNTILLKSTIFYSHDQNSFSVERLHFGCRDWMQKSSQLVITFKTVWYILLTATAVVNKFVL